MFPPYIAPYRESYNTQHVLIRKFEEWGKNLDKNHIVGAVLTDHSKAFNCIAYDLLIAELSIYGYNGNTVKYIYTYLKNRKQCVCIFCDFGGFAGIVEPVIFLRI